MPAFAITVLPVPVGTVTSTLAPETIWRIACSCTGYGSRPRCQRKRSTKESSRSATDGGKRRLYTASMDRAREVRAAATVAARRGVVGAPDVLAARANVIVRIGDVVARVALLTAEVRDDPAAW